MGNTNNSEYIDDSDSLVSSVPIIITDEIFSYLPRLNYVRINSLHFSPDTYKITLLAYDHIELLIELNNIELAPSVRETVEKLLNIFGEAEISAHRDVYFTDALFNTLIHLENKNIPRKSIKLAITV